MLLAVVLLLGFSACDENADEDNQIEDLEHRIEKLESEDREQKTEDSEEERIMVPNLLNLAYEDINATIVLVYAKE